MSIQDENFKKKYLQMTSQYSTPASYITEYVEKNPRHLDKIRGLHQQGIDDLTIAKAIMYKESSPSLLQEFKGGVKEDFYSTLMGAEYAASLAANLAGQEAPGLLDKALEFQRKAEEGAGAVPDIFEAKGIGEIAHGATHMAGSLAGFMASIVAGGGLGAFIGKGAVKLSAKKIASALSKRAMEKYGGEAGIKEAGKAAAKKYLERGIIKKRIQKAGGLGAKIGAFSAVTPPLIGQQYAAGGFEHPAQAITGGAATGALYTLSPLSMLRALKGGTTLTSKINADLLKSVVKSKTALNYPRTTSTAIEGLKQSIEQSAILSSAAMTSRFGSNLNLVSPEALKEYKESGIIGGGLGLIGGGIAGRFGKTGKRLVAASKLSKIKEAFKIEKKTTPTIKGLPAIPETTPLGKPIINKELLNILGLMVVLTVMI